jgi:hypothetical protein
MSDHNRSYVGDIVKNLRNITLEVLPQAGFLQTGIKGFSIYHITEPTGMQRCFYSPVAILLLQGAKHSVIGSEEFFYRENQYMITGVDLPLTSRICEASPEKPFLALTLELDGHMISELLAEIPALKARQESFRSMAVADADYHLIQAFSRLTELAGQPDQQSILAPMNIRELHYRQ